MHLDAPSYLDSLNQQQRDAVLHGTRESNSAHSPLLILAGAGTGKTNTLAHRVGHLIVSGADPERILLLTFTRRAAQEMTRRAERIVAMARKQSVARHGRLRWSGTFHSIANRLLRVHAHAVGLDPSFTVLDRSDAEDLMNLIRSDAGLSARSKRFPKKGTCVSIYSRTVNAQTTLSECLQHAFPWCADWESELKQLFRDYVRAKQSRNLLDYDDLLLYWYHLMQDPTLAEAVRAGFDHVLVDEYQDTNALQAAALLRLAEGNQSLTVVGDDAQAIYSFRAATVHNILNFPNQVSQPTHQVTLAQNYRSTRAILEAANAVINQSQLTHNKQLCSQRTIGEKPQLVTASDELSQVDYVVSTILANREAGTQLKQQAVLFRAAHHSDALEIELGRRNIPFVKYGGLKFLESAHVKDLLCLLRWIENPRDSVAGFRVLQLLPGVGPKTARHALAHVDEANGQLSALRTFSPPAASREHWTTLNALLPKASAATWPTDIAQLRTFYDPLVEELYDAAHVRCDELDQLEHIATQFPTRERFLTELTLDPPSSSGDWSGDPLLDEDYLILSTIHSSKGQEWDNVFILNVVDGCIPSEMAAGSPDQIEEERRLLYVAMTRARDQLHLIHPQRMYITQQHRHGDRHVYTPASRFLPQSVRALFAQHSYGHAQNSDMPPSQPQHSIDLSARMRDMW